MIFLLSSFRFFMVAYPHLMIGFLFHDPFIPELCQHLQHVDANLLRIIIQLLMKYKGFKEFQSG